MPNIGPWFIEYTYDTNIVFQAGLENWQREGNWFGPGRLSNSWLDGFETAKAAYEQLLMSHYVNHGNSGLQAYCYRIINQDTLEVALFHAGRQATSQLSFNRIAECAQSSEPENESEKKSMIKTGIVREAGKLMLVIDAKEFHDELDKIGCTFTGDKYDNRPTSAAAIATNRFEMSTDCLLTRKYPAKFDLSAVWSTPPTINQLKTLCQSAETAGRKILDHYQPIDISIEIQKKLLK